jgi:hypothetical protein
MILAIKILATRKYEEVAISRCARLAATTSLQNVHLVMDFIRIPLNLAVLISDLDQRKDTYHNSDGKNYNSTYYSNIDGG